jgi:hypothetical protein
VARSPRPWESRGSHPSRSLVYIDMKGRVRALIRECARRETWEHVEMLQEFQKELETLRGMPREDALQNIDGLCEQAATIIVAFECMITNRATMAAFLEVEELPQAMERVRGTFSSKNRNRNAARWKWRISCPADRFHVDELEGRIGDYAREAAE